MRPVPCCPASPSKRPVRPCSNGFAPSSPTVRASYNITDLRPGVYTVTFSLAGFSLVRRESIELTASFTATVNADMRVGALERRSRLSGATPTVDLQNVVQQKVITREVFDALPSDRVVGCRRCSSPVSE